MLDACCRGNLLRLGSSDLGQHRREQASCCCFCFIVRYVCQRCTLFGYFRNRRNLRLRKVRKHDGAPFDRLCLCNFDGLLRRKRNRTLNRYRNEGRIRVNELALVRMLIGLLFVRSFDPRCLFGFFFLGLGCFLLARNEGRNGRFRRLHFFHFCKQVAHVDRRHGRRRIRRSHRCFLFRALLFHRNKLAAILAHLFDRFVCFNAHLLTRRDTPCRFVMHACFNLLVSNCNARLFFWRNSVVRSTQGRTCFLFAHFARCSVFGMCRSRSSLRQLLLLQRRRHRCCFT